MKRKFILLSCLIASMLLIFAFSTTASAAEIVASGSCGENVTYTLDSAGVCTISGTGKMDGYLYRSKRPWNEYTVKSVCISSGVTNIGYGAFAQCAELRSITISNTVTSIGESAFYWCPGLTNIIIPDSVTYIGDFAFQYCTGLTNLIIPKSVTSINWNAFSGCTGLKSLSISAGVKNCSGAFVNLPNLESIEVDPNNQSYKSSGNCLIDIESKMLVLGCKNSVIPTDGCVECIGPYSFAGCSELKNIVIPESVTEIREEAFNSCDGLTNIIIPENIVSIGDGAFCYCDNITEMYILNPDCYYGGDYTNENRIVYSHSGGRIEELSKENNYKFKAIHIGDGTTVSVAATCTNAGQTYEKCKYCDEKANVVEIPALGHDFTGVSRTNSDGSISYKCTRCDEYGGTVMPPEKKLDEITGTKRLTQNNVDILVAPVEMTVSTVLGSANGSKLVDKNGEEITDTKTPLSTGMKVILGKTSVTISVAGDVDSDGTISVSDARLALRAAVKLDTLADAYFTSADVDFSEDISVSDARLILRAAVKLDDPKKAWIK